MKNYNLNHSVRTEPPALSAVTQSADIFKKIDASQNTLPQCVWVINVALT